MTLLTTLNLLTLPPNAPTPPSLAPTFLIWNFVFSYALLSTRLIKNYYKFDHNVCPREDIQKYGNVLVSEGKLSREKLDMIKRWEAAHANSVEGYTLFVAGVLLGLHAGVPTEKLNGLMALYSVARVAHAAAYIWIAEWKASYLRSLLWWVGNGCCFSMMILAGKRL